MTGAFTRRDGAASIRQDLELVYTYFPRLKIRRTSTAGYTSGGEQQMTALGRALMARPKMILLDEPSMGLAPQLVEEIFEIVKTLNEAEQVTFLLAEQNTNMALRYSHYGYILENGRIVMEGDAASIPIIGLTAAATPREVESCLDAGMNDYLTKPLDSAALEPKLQQWLGTQ